MRCDGNSARCEVFGLLRNSWAFFTDSWAFFIDSWPFFNINKASALLVGALIFGAAAADLIFFIPIFHLDFAIGLELHADGGGGSDGGRNEG